MNSPSICRSFIVHWIARLAGLALASVALLFCASAAQARGIAANSHSGQSVWFVEMGPSKTSPASPSQTSSLPLTPAARAVAP